MRIFGKRTVYLISTFLIIFFMSTSLSYGGTWKPYKFQIGERYEFKIILGEDISSEDERKEATYILEINDFPAKEGFVELSFTTKSLLEEEELSYEKVFSFEGLGIPLSILIINPMYSVIFEQIDLEVGEKMKILGFGTVKVTGKENIGGRDGFVCQLFQTSDGEEKLVVEWVIDPELALPLRAKNFEDGKLESLFELISYERK